MTQKRDTTHLWMNVVGNRRNIVEINGIHNHIDQASFSHRSSFSIIVPDNVGPMQVAKLLLVDFLLEKFPHQQLCDVPHLPLLQKKNCQHDLHHHSNL